jgi:hypothetical protein
MECANYLRKTAGGGREGECKYIDFDYGCIRNIFFSKEKKIGEGREGGDKND